MPQTESQRDWILRKIIEVREYLDVCEAHPHIVSGIKFTDGLQVNPGLGTAIPMIMIAIDIKESLYREIKKAK